MWTHLPSRIKTTSKITQMVTHTTTIIIIKSTPALTLIMSKPQIIVTTLPGIQAAPIKRPVIILS